MKRAAAKGMLLPCLLLIVISTHAQKKNYTFDQIFRNGETNVARQLPVVKGWADDTHYILAAMGLLAGKDPKKSIRIMKKNILKLA